MRPMGSVSDTYSPMLVPESAEETPKNVGLAQNPQPFWEIPSLPSAAGLRTLSQNPQPFWDVPHGCPAQLGHGAGRTGFFIRGSGAQNGACGVRFGYVQPDAAFKIDRADPEKISECAKSSPLLDAPPFPPYIVGSGFWVPYPREPLAPIYNICANGRHANPAVWDLKPR